MLILFDVGNTAVKYGIYQGSRFQAHGFVKINDIPKFVKKLTKSGKNNLINIVISSVVPKISDILKKEFGRIPKAKLWFLGQNLPISIKHRYQNIKKLGMDRIVNVYGALRMYKPPLAVLDFGTAITLDYVSAKGVFEGGMIIPGPETALKALSDKAALLPKNLVFPKKHKAFLGRSTKDCMESGILEGYGALTEGLIRRTKDKYGSKVRVIATGGLSEVIKTYSQGIDILDPHHSIKSLLILFKDFSNCHPERKCSE